MAKAVSLAQIAHVAHVAGFGIEGAVDGHMHKLTDAQRLRELATAVAISCAENKSHDPAAINHNTNGTIDVGLWQINSIHFAEIGTDAEHLKDPQSNAIAANSVYARRGNHFTPWVTFNAGLYIPYMGAALLVARTELGVNVGAGKGTGDIPNSASADNGLDKGIAKGGTLVTNAADAALATGKFLAKLSSGNTWVRLVEVVFGGIFILAGLALLAKELGAASTATNLVKAVPVAKTVKVAKKLSTVLPK